MTTNSSLSALHNLTDAVWKAGGNDGRCPPDKYPSFRQLDDLITTTAWGSKRVSKKGARNTYT